jgi:hypothetical protein
MNGKLTSNQSVLIILIQLRKPSPLHQTPPLLYQAMLLLYQALPLLHLSSKRDNLFTQLKTANHISLPISRVNTHGLLNNMPLAMRLNGATRLISLLPETLIVLITQDHQDWFQILPTLPKLLPTLPKLMATLPKPLPILPKLMATLPKALPTLPKLNQTLPKLLLIHPKLLPTLHSSRRKFIQRRIVTPISPHTLRGTMHGLMASIMFPTKSRGPRRPTSLLLITSIGLSTSKELTPDSIQLFLSNS